MPLRRRLLLVLALAGAGTAAPDDPVRPAEARTGARPAAAVRCLGAAARDPRAPCTNPALRRVVVPTPAQARRIANAPCARVEPLACAFGAPAGTARATIALVGDSHAMHWRAALDVVARRRGWHGLSVTRTSCRFSALQAPMPEPKRSRCAKWQHLVPAWFARHPEVRTVFVSQLVRRHDVEAHADAHVALWRSLPSTVRRIVVLRDSPRARPGTVACVTRAIARARDAGAACAVPRAAAVHPDPAVLAARRLGAPRAHVVDLTTTFCGPRACPPVIGGVLVLKDTHHLTQPFAFTLGPVLDRALGRVPLGAAPAQVPQKVR